MSTHSQSPDHPPLASTPSLGAGVRGHARRASRPPERRSRNQFEFELQCSLVWQFRDLVPPNVAMILALENGEDRSAETLSRLHAKGLVDGVPDLLVVAQQRRLLWIEVKLETTLQHLRTRPTENQREFHAMLHWFGQPYAVVRNQDQFWAAIDAELGIAHGPPPPVQPSLLGHGRL